MPFQYSIPRKPRPKVQLQRPEPAPKEQEQIGLINGLVPGSVQEWRVAVSLWKFKLEFEYQVPIRGGRRLRGGRVLDFLVYAPFPIPVPVMGTYWHSGAKSEDDRMMLALLEQEYHREPVPLYEYELQSQDEADETVQRKIV